jgi:hypothetical protein
MVLTNNGATRLGRCLQSIVDAGIAGELVVFIDDTTTDDSESIARGFTARVSRLATGGYIESSLARMAAACSGEFVLRIDDDETLGGDWSAPLDAGDGFACTHFLVPRRWLVPGEDCFISSAPWWPDLQVRLLRNDPSIVHWPTEIHERTIVKGAGAVLWDRWIDHHVLIQQSRAERVRKCADYQRVRPDKHLSHFYLWEEQAVRLSPYCANGAVAEPLAAGAVVSFDAQGAAGQYQLNGWSHAEPWGTWTDGPEAVLQIPLTRPPRGAVDLALEAHAFIRTAHPRLHVSVLCAGAVVAEWQIETAECATYRATIPEWLAVREGALLTIALRMERTASPHALGESPDARQLGLGVRRLRVEPRAATPTSSARRPTSPLPPWRRAHPW